MTCMCHSIGGHDAPNRIFEYSDDLTARIFFRVSLIFYNRDSPPCGSGVTLLAPMKARPRLGC